MNAKREKERKRTSGDGRKTDIRRAGERGCKVKQSTAYCDSDDWLHWIMLPTEYTYAHTHKHTHTRYTYTWICQLGQ